MQENTFVKMLSNSTKKEMEKKKVSLSQHLLSYNQNLEYGHTSPCVETQELACDINFFHFSRC